MIKSLIRTNIKNTMSFFNNANLMPTKNTGGKTEIYINIDWNISRL